MATALAPATAAPPTRRSGFLISPVVDSLALIFSPLLALGATWLLAGTPYATRRLALFGAESPLPAFFIASATAAHLVLTFARSHGNRTIFAAHPWRFTVVPCLLLVALVGSTWLRAAAAVVAVLWDVHHSGLQTFGLARMYERLSGADPAAGRQLDLWLNHVLYAGPIFAGAGFLHHLFAFYHFESVGAAFFTSIPAAGRELQPAIALAVLVVGGGLLACYASGQWKLARAGHRLCWQKLALLGSTAICSCVSWGADSFGLALFTMKLFHVVQYFVLVGWMERANLSARLLGGGLQLGFAGSVGALLAGSILWGLWAAQQSALLPRSELALSLILCVTLLHFWYDGFIWSVRRRQL